jgi:hypothetical protein
MSELPFSDFGLKWFQDIVERITQWFTEELTQGLRDISTSLFSTPLPDGEGVSRVFSKPPESNGLWQGIYEATVAGEMMIFGLLVLFVCVQARHFARIFDIGSAYERRKAQRSSWTGALLIVGWYWVAVLTLYVVEGLTIALLPDVRAVAESLITILPEALNTPIVTLAMAAVGGISILLLQALFFIREVLLYVFLYGMPIGLGIAYGNVPVVSSVAKRICSQFVPLAILPLPAAVLFRGYEFLFTGGTRLPVSEAFLQYLVVISLPVIALYVTWKTFKYASPAAARILGTAGRGTVMLGTAAGAAYLGKPMTAMVAGTRGPKAALGTAAARSYGTRNTSGESTPEMNAQFDYDYRRTENDPQHE